MPLSIIMASPHAHMSFILLPSSFVLHLSSFIFLYCSFILLPSSFIFLSPAWPSPHAHTNQLAVQQGLSQDMASTHEDARGVNTKRTSAGTWLETLQWVPREDMGGWKVRAALLFNVLARLTCTP